MNTKTLDLSNAKKTALVGMMSALICVCGPLSVPIGLIPVSLVPLAIFLSTNILGKKYGTLSCVVYVLIGLAGVPVFAGFTAGPAKLLGPTGGYILAYPIMAYISGLLLERSKNIFLNMLGCLAALIVAYAIGTVWLSFQASMTFAAALLVAVVPFVPFDIVKIVIAVLLGKTVRERIV